MPSGGTTDVDCRFTGGLVGVEPLSYRLQKRNVRSLAFGLSYGSGGSKNRFCGSVYSVLK
jgi:hypothetical protein